VLVATAEPFKLWVSVVVQTLAVVVADAGADDAVNREDSIVEGDAEAPGGDTTTVFVATADPLED